MTVALSYTGGLQGTGDTRSPLYISIVSQVIVPLGYCTILQATRGLQANDIWLAIVLGHMTRCLLSFGRFRQQKWRNIRRRHRAGTDLTRSRTVGRWAVGRWVQVGRRRVLPASHPPARQIGHA